MKLAEDDPELLVLVAACTKHIFKIERLVDTLTLAQSDGIAQRTRKAFRSIRIEGKLRTLQEKLEPFKTSLILYHEVKRCTAPDVLESSGEVCHILPASSRSHLVKRSGILVQISQSLMKTAEEAPKVVVLVGLGGQEKTSLAIEYCRDAATKARYMVILWIDATSRQALALSLGAAARALGNQRRNSYDLESASALIRRIIADKSWLLVFDNYDHPDAFGKLADIYPSTGDGTVLITSRHRGNEILGTSIDVNGMEEDEGVELLLSRTKHSTGDPSTRLKARKILSLFGNLPLAIDQAGAYIGARNLDLSLFEKHYDDRKELILTQTPTAWDYTRIIEEESNKQAPLSVLTTWELSFAQFGASTGRRERVESFLSIAALFHHTAISERIFSHYLESTPAAHWMALFTSGNEWDQYKFQDLLAELSALSLLQDVQTVDNEHSFTLHPLVREWLRFRVPRGKRVSHVLESSLVLANHARLCLVKGTREMARNVILHLDALIMSCRGFLEAECRMGRGDFRDPGLQFAEFYVHYGHCQKAAALFEDVLRDDQQLYGVNHLSTLDSICRLADAYNRDGR